MRWFGLLLLLSAWGCGDTRGSDAGVMDGGVSASDAGTGLDAGASPIDAGSIPGLDAGPAGADAGPPDPNVLVWRLDGTEVARSTGAEAGPDYLFLPHWGRNVQAYFTSPPAPGTYRCPDMELGSNVRVGLLTMDNMWANLDGLPDRWKTLNITNCSFTPDTYTVTLELTSTTSRYVGTLHIEVVGAAERAGEVLTLDGTFDIPF